MNPKTFIVKAHKDFSITEAVEVREFKTWIADAIGFRVLEFRQDGDTITFTLEKHMVIKDLE
jgi:hypothetical protein